MEKAKKRNISISGSGTAAGGEYDQVKVNGSAHINSDIECEIFKCNGSAHIEGNIKTATAKVNGSSHVEGNMEAREMIINGSTDIDGNLTSSEVKIQGSSTIKGDLKGKEINVRGTASITGNVSSDEIDVKGQVIIGGDCEAESFLARGHFKINGLLNAGNIDIELLRLCEAKEIGGENISVKRNLDFSGFKKILKFFMGQEKDQLTAEVIEGDHVSLEYTHAKVVRGNTIEIGPGCVIDRIEYKQSLELDENAKIGTQEKI
ncbi:polymer-forming cytoskeletal protein [Fictibacillus phosphorivorans]|uniref:polymer-forming cytoskeletal protein n=1 Tax=Fictibacillus phosphorivorans TaxID=1221500 RepID=UPI00203AF2E3|nr:polymer-forming cytoskeletal protein [Fictibacillus phosphorivorans]MCM3717540.1 polymer-forming cytoskeletal protein [Fictibacillus phosphorivorans]MCM3775235.1 polymer-forming cytoskeletal protein [Fictibacillus phosphorivorans]